MEYDVPVQNPTYGLGANPSPLDDRDYPVSALFAALDVDPPLALPLTFRVRPVAPILNQGDTPQCVAFSAAGLKAHQDYNDPIVGKWWDFDEPRFFTAIGGGPNGAYIRSAMSELLKVGYPPVGQLTLAGEHRIAAYYEVPVNVAAIKETIYQFGEVLFGSFWYNSWFKTTVGGILPAPDVRAGGHAIRCVGWDDSKGFLLANSWGTGWGVDGYCWMPYARLSSVFEVWKAVDQEVKPPAPPLFHWHVKKDATVRIYTLSAAGVIQRGYGTFVWRSNSSSAPCTRPVKRTTWDGKTATTVKCLSGAFVGKTVQVAPPGTYVT
jgi:hypothetical protein